MKILFLTPRDSKTNFGGVERHVRLLTEELVRRGHEVREISLGRTFAFKFSAWVYLWKNRELLGWADIIHVHDVFWWVGPFLLIAKITKLREKREPRVFVTFHGWEGVCPPTRSAVWQKRLAAFLSDGTVGVGDFYRKWYGVKPDRIVWGAASKLKVKSEKLKVDKNRYNVIFFGRLEEVNGIEMVIRAINRLNKSYKDYKNYKKNDDNSFKDSPSHSRRRILFLFVGDGSFRKQAEKVGEVTGMEAEPWKYLADADIVIASSYLAILEGAAMGKRIIAMANNPLKRDYLEGHPLRKYFKICRSADELAREIIKSIEETPRLGGESPLRAKLWARGQTAERLADEYEKLWNTKLA